MNMHKISLTNSSVVSWSSIKVYLWSKPRKRYLRKRKPGGRINIPLRAHKSSLLDTFVKVTCSTSLAQVYLLDKPRNRNGYLCQKPRGSIPAREVYLLHKPRSNILVREASPRFPCSRSLANVDLQHKPHESILAQKSSPKFTCSTSLAKFYLLHKPHERILVQEVQSKFTCSRSLAQVHLLEKPRKRSLVREASCKYTCARVLMEVATTTNLLDKPCGSI
jgi:hypothetical protein